MRMPWFVLAAAEVLAVIGCGGEQDSFQQGTASFGAFPSDRTTRNRDGEPVGPDELPAEPSLDDYLRHAALNNPGLAAAFHRWQAAGQRVVRAKALPDPRLSYRYFIEQVETRVGAQRQGFELSQTLPWPSKLARRGDAATAEARGRRQRFEAARWRLSYQVKIAYYEYYYLGRAIEIVQDSRDLVRHFEAVARARYRVAVGSHPDVIRAQVELGKIADRLRTLKDLRGPLAARLNAVLNRPAGTPVPWPVQVVAAPVSVTDEQLLAWLAESNPQLKALDARIAAGHSRIELARADYFPDVTLGVGYIDTAGAVTSPRPPDAGTDPVVAMVSVNLPIWWHKLAAGVREARLGRRQAVYERADKLNALGAELKLAAHGFRDAERKMALYGQSLVPKAVEAVEAAEAAFRTGKGTFGELIDAQRLMLEFQLARRRALANRMQRLAELEMLVGRPIAILSNADGG